MKTLEVTLKQHTPLIHFQHDQYGATLRASEVKPKLDKFILTKLGENEGYEKGCNIAKNKGWLVGKGEHDALNYKIKIVCTGNIETMFINEKKYYSKNHEQNRKPFIVENGNKYLAKDRKDGRRIIDLQPYPLFFGNMDKDINDSDEYRKMVYTKDVIKLQLNVLNDGLYDYIEKNKTILSDFFLNHNFGTRQSKGFGSFYVEENTECYKKPDTKYKFALEEINECDYRKLYDSIDLFYKTLRSGINIKNLYFKSLAFMYAKDELKAHWDKRMIKEHFYNNIDERRKDSLILQINNHEGKEPLAYVSKNGYDVRDLLGFSTTERWMSFNDTVEKKVAIEDNGKYRFPKRQEKLPVDRMPSPVLIKPIWLNGKYHIFLILRDNMVDLETFKSQRYVCVSSLKEKDITGKYNKSFKLEIPKDFTSEKYFEYIFKTLNFDIKSHVEMRFHSDDNFKLLEKIFNEIKGNL